MRRFHHSIETTASTAEIWEHWTNLEGWSEWDSELEYASLEGPFQEGQLGKIKPVKGPESEIYLSGVRELSSFTVNVVLPLNTRLEIWHTLMSKKDTREITHGVRIEGRLSWVYAVLLGAPMKMNLPIAMENLKKAMEGENYVPTPDPVEEGEKKEQEKPEETEDSTESTEVETEQKEEQA